MPGYGTPDNPFAEAPHAGGWIIGVEWGRKAILIKSPTGVADPVAIGTTPADLLSSGSWCTWFSKADAATGNGADAFDMVLSELGGGFGGAVRYGSIDPFWGNPGVFDLGTGLYPKFNSTSDDGELHWTIRPDDSITLVDTRSVPEGEFNTRVDTSVMDLAQWHCVLLSWRVGVGATIAVDDVVKTIAFEPEPFTGVDGGDVQNDVGAVPAYRSKIYLMRGHDVTRYDWWLSSEYIDFTVTDNRRRFITEDKKPVSLGANGELGSPTARQPEFFFRSRRTLESFTVNRGTAGTVSWTTTADDPTPIDPVWSTSLKPESAG